MSLDTDLLEFNPGPPDLSFLDKPGPQPHNQIPAKMALAMESVHQPRPAVPIEREAVRQFAAGIEQHADVFVPVMLKLLAKPFGELMRAMREGRKPG